eukprot:1160919-Pelagomonas_calceolata.AAC.4
MDTCSVHEAKQNPSRQIGYIGILPAPRYFAPPQNVGYIGNSPPPQYFCARAPWLSKACMPSSSWTWVRREEGAGILRAHTLRRAEIKRQVLLNHEWTHGSFIKSIFEQPGYGDNLSIVWLRQRNLYRQRESLDKAQSLAPQPPRQQDKQRHAVLDLLNHAAPLQAPA